MHILFPALTVIAPSQSPRPAHRINVVCDYDITECYGRPCGLPAMLRARTTRVARLQHEVLNDAVKGAALVPGRLPIPPVAGERSTHRSLQQAHSQARAPELAQSPYKHTHLNSPVISCLKFSAVFGQMSANSSIFILPAGMPPMVTSAEQAFYLSVLVDDTMCADTHKCTRHQANNSASTPKKTTGLLATGCRRCHCVTSPAMHQQFSCTQLLSACVQVFTSGCKQSSCLKSRP